jgi:hypothetical protein
MAVKLAQLDEDIVLWRKRRRHPLRYRRGSDNLASRGQPHRGDDPMPSGREALDEPFRAFPSWFLRITRDRCGKDRMLNEAPVLAGNMTIRDLNAKMRHDGCGGRAGRVELITGIEGASSRPVRRIVLRDG